MDCLLQVQTSWKALKKLLLLIFTHLTLNTERRVVSRATLALLLRYMSELYTSDCTFHIQSSYLQKCIEGR